jgi:5-formyltetrahydrofolate cyclo-ligase
MAKTMADDKNSVRRIMKESRQALPHERASAVSAAAQERLIASGFYQSARSVVLYAAVDNEVATDLIFTDARRAGREVYYPRVDPVFKSIALVAVRDLRELTPGAFGIPEPPAGDAIGVERLEAALICLPGLAFTLSGARLGRGGGYYDRLLDRIAGQATTVGLAYSFQVLDSLPQTPRDRRVDYVVTEFAVRSTAPMHSGESPAAGASTGPSAGEPQIHRGGYPDV